MLPSHSKEMMIAYLKHKCPIEVIYIYIYIHNDYNWGASITNSIPKLLHRRGSDDPGDPGPATASGGG